MIALYVVLGIIILVSAVFVSWSKTPKGRGVIGEFNVRLILGKTKEGEKYVFNNVMIKDENKTSQIDHIVVNKSGIYVIETKNYSGIISGRQEQLEWTQTLSYGKVKNTFYNPVKQNATHIYRLNKLLDMDVVFNSVIVFVQGNTKYIHSGNVYDIQGLKKILKNKNDIFTSEDIAKIANEIANISTKSVSMKEHVAEIKEMKSNVESGICPRCGGNLILKDGKYGKFYGCSNYPKCKFIKK